MMIRALHRRLPARLVLVGVLLALPTVPPGASASTLRPSKIDVASGPPTTDESAPAQPMSAELVRRSDGSWVIVKLQQTETLVERSTPIESNPELAETVDRYRLALSRGDAHALSTVWIMNPAERQQAGQLARGNTRFAVTITGATADVEGDRAAISFLEQRAESELPVRRRASRSRSRGMAAFDPAGAWDALPSR